MKKTGTCLLLILLTAISCSQINIQRLPSNENTVSNELIGIYTGTFDPPTNAHKEIMKLAIEKYHVSSLIIYINVSGTKDFKTSYLERKIMVAGMLGESASKVKIIPVLQENKEDIIEEVSNGVHTIQFSGQDSFDTMPADVVLARNRKWVVIARGDIEINIPDGSNVEVITPIDNTSSSEVRGLILQNRLDQANVDPFVKNYIRQNSLYLPATGEAAQIKLSTYEKAFDQYVRELKKKRPGLNLKDVMIPNYLPEQSMSAWPTKFTNLIMEREGMKGAAAEEYRTFSLNLLEEILINIPKKNSTPALNNPCDPIQLIHAFSVHP